MKKCLRVVFSKLIYILVFVVIQILAFGVMFKFFWEQFPYFYFVCVALSVIAAAHILNSTSNPAYKIAWLIPIFLLPIFGGLLYLLFGYNRAGRRAKKLEASVMRQYLRSIRAFPSDEKAISEADDEAALQSRYIVRSSGCLPYAHTETKYFPLGQDMYGTLLDDLRQAKRFIFMEYFIVQEGIMWDTILDILQEKASSGVEVRVMYDDFGCLFTLPRHYEKKLAAMGIRTQIFNPFNSIMTPRFNNRDHRKICVIDGETAYTGGINLADEYINVYQKYGYWKDTAIRLHGDAVWSLTVQFLSLWNVSSKSQDVFTNYAPAKEWISSIPSDGFVQPYSDIPMDGELVGETVYLNILNRSKRYVYITTPYLIIDNETATALQNAAKCGIDVRIITPHIPDKKIVFFLTRSYYRQLIEAGVRIFEYTPGFIHAKTMVSDDKYAVVGTINLDYRSLYLHVECAAWLYGTSSVQDVREDFLATEAVSQEVKLSDIGELSWIKKLFLSILRAFAPLL